MRLPAPRVFAGRYYGAWLMRVAMYYHNHDVRIEEMQDPLPGPGEVVVRVRAAGICGSDLLEWYRRPRAPRVLGHEVTGEIAAVGQGVTRFHEGDRVFVTHHVPCETCRYCRDGHPTVCDMLRSTGFDPGGFAELIRVPKVNVEKGMFRLPEGVSFDRGSFIEPLGCVIRGQDLAGVREGHRVLVVGTGPTGLLHLQLAKYRGARTVAVDRNPARRRLAERFAHDVREKEKEAEADRVIVCAGERSAYEAGLRAVDRGGTVLFFAPLEPGTRVDVPLDRMWWNEVTVRSSYAAGPTELREAARLIADERIDVEGLISHRLPLNEIQKGFDLARSGGESLKVIVHPQEWRP